MPLLLIHSLRLKLCKYIVHDAALIEHIWKNFKVSKQKHAITIIFHENKFAETRERFKEYNILNIYQLNIFDNLFFLHCVKNGKALNVFLSNFLRPSHHYPTSYSGNNYIVTSFKIVKTKYRIIIHPLKLGNIILNIEEKLIENSVICTVNIKTKLVLLEKDIIYF